MTMAGMYLLKKEGYNDEKTKLAIKMLLVDRKDEFRWISDTLFSKNPKSIKQIPNKQEFILNFCFEVSEEFKVWTGEKPLQANSGVTTLSILRILGRDKKSMNNLVMLLTICYDIAEDFKVIYNRI